MLRIFRDVCKAVKAMHTYRVTEGSSHATISEEDDIEQTENERSSEALLTHEQSEEPATVAVSITDTENVGEIVPYGK